jgi:hypothetical protein
MLLTDWDPTAIGVGNPGDSVALTPWKAAPWTFDELDPANMPITRGEGFLPVVDANRQALALRAADDNALDLRAVRHFTVLDHDATRFALRPSM